MASHGRGAASCISGPLGTSLHPQCALLAHLEKTEILPRLQCQTLGRNWLLPCSHGVCHGLPGMSHTSPGLGEHTPTIPHILNGSYTFGLHDRSEDSSAFSGWCVGLVASALLCHSVKKTGATLLADHLLSVLSSAGASVLDTHRTQDCLSRAHHSCVVVPVREYVWEALSSKQPSFHSLPFSCFP